MRISTTKEYDSDNGISDAENIISRYINEIIGVILFYPYNHKDSAEWYEKPLKNGFVIRKNDFEELICYPYVGYIGLHSHKPQKLEEFKKFLNDRKVKYYEVPENQDGIDIWRECFEEKNDVVQAEKIMEVCNSYRIKEWIKELRT
ncbi:hypothetical protein [Pseudolactococcus laudensis]|uniref:hypothetical protein n=1 Tax=Pseudolactococcus laudensis TaxID=1494461 RepID=UPI002FC69A5E